MEKYSRVVGGGILFYFLLLSSVSNAQVTIITQPTNVTVCLTEGTTATFTCVVDRRGIDITNADWRILVGGAFLSVDGRARHMDDPIVLTNDTVTDILTITNVSVNDNGAQYRCEPFGDVISDVATLTVLDPPAITTVEVTGRCTNDFTVSWTTASNEEGLTYTVSVVPDGTSVDLMDTSRNVTGLTPDTTYTVSVFTRLTTTLITPCLGIPYATTITTLAVEAGVPQSVQNLRNSSTATEIIIEWDSPDGPSNCGPVFYYIVTIVGRNAMNTFEERAEFSDLINGTNYTISVAAVNRAGTGPTSMITVTGNAKATGGGGTTTSSSKSSGLSGGAIAGIIIAILVVIVIIIVIICGVLYWRYKKKNDNKVPLKPSTSPDSPPSADSAKSVGSTKPVHSAKPTAKKAKSAKTKATSKKQETSVSGGVEYAALQHDSSGTSRPPPTVDHTKKVDYVEVKEHEPLAYAQVQHEAGSENKPIQGAPQVEYKEVWHQ